MGNDAIKDSYNNLQISIYKGKSFYSDSPPFSPDESYPEYIFQTLISKGPNPAYDSVRNSFKLLGLDKNNFGTSIWNPLSDIIKPGYTVVIKPNFVLSSHGEGKNLFSIITHPSVIRPIVDYVYKALNGNGKIIIADAPQMDCDFNELLEQTNLYSIQELYLKEFDFEVEIYDLRDFWLDIKNSGVDFVGRRKKLSGDPLGSVTINLGEESEFYGIQKYDKFYGADYNRSETMKHHHNGIHEYSISRTILNSDVIISVPKLKVHKKVGVTLNSKGLVGINTNKNCLIHYTLGYPEEGGDQFPSNVLSKKEKAVIKAQRYLFDLLLSKHNHMLDIIYAYIHNIYKRCFKPIGIMISQENRMLDGGNWYGNDSAWRMVSDLMKIAFYSDRNGVLRNEPQRKIFSVVDGIIGGENNGPLTPDEKRAGIVMAGFNPVAVDIAGTRLMGFDWRKLKWLINLVQNKHFNFFVDNFNNIQIQSNFSAFTKMYKTVDPLLAFQPHPGWQGHIEIA